MTRTPKKVLIAGLTAALALTGCGGPAPESAAADVVAAELVAYEQGYDSEAAADSPEVRPRAVRKLLRKSTLHGEVVVQGEDGARTIAVQRGEVTAVDGSAFTVRSADGFETTWTFGDPLRVVQNREKAGRDAVRDGVKVGVGGVRDGSATTARLIIVG